MFSTSARPFKACSRAIGRRVTLDSEVRTQGGYIIVARVRPRATERWAASKCRNERRVTHWGYTTNLA